MWLTDRSIGNACPSVGSKHDWEYDASARQVCFIIALSSVCGHSTIRMWCVQAEVLQVTCILGSGLMLFSSRGDRSSYEGFYTAI
jgi:hypothetical protein